MPDSTIYVENLVDVAEVPAGSDLVRGSCVACAITLGSGTYKRGELLMSSGNNEFVTATAAGISSAAELCLLSQNIEVPADNIAVVSGYFQGTFNSSAVVLSYEEEANTHETLIESIRVPLRMKGIYLV